MPTLTDIRAAFERRKGQKEAVLEAIGSSERQIDLIQTKAKYADEARLIIQTVAASTQAELVYHITEIVNLAEAAVFDNPYTLSLEFVLKRGRSEAVLRFVRGDNDLDPMTETGGGAIDVAAFSLRVALWLLKQPHSRNTLILDEPFIRLKGRTANIRALNMVKQVSHEMGLQIIMVSDERASREDIVASSDKVFEVVLIKGESNVKALVEEPKESQPVQHDHNPKQEKVSLDTTDRAQSEMPAPRRRRTT